MKASDLIECVANEFHQSAGWPKYGVLDLELIEEGGLELVLQEVPSDTLSVYGQDLSAEIRFASLDAYREYGVDGEEDLDNFARVASLFAKRAEIADPTPRKPNPKVTACEISDHIGINGLPLLRLLRLIEQFGWRLQAGGTRGENLQEWSFTIPPSAVYYRNIKGYESLAQRIQQHRDAESMRFRREHGFEPDAAFDTSDENGIGLLGNADLPPYYSIELHQEVIDATNSLLASGHYPEAVRKAAQGFEAYLQSISNDHNSIGLDLVGKVLGGDNPIIALNSNQSLKEKNEQRGFLFFAKGIMSALRNVYSHGTFEEIPREIALDYIVIISAVWKRIEQVMGKGEGM